MIERIYNFLFNPKLEGYTFFKTLLYSIGYSIIVFILYYLLRRKNWIKLDERLVIHSYFLSLPFVAIRVLEDYSILQGILFITPWIEIMYVVSFLVSLFVLVRILKVHNYEKVSVVMSPLVFFSLILHLEDRFNFFIFLLNAILGMFFILLFFSLGFVNLYDRLVLLTHAYEALVTVFNVVFLGFYEQHVISRIFLEISPILFLSAKISFVLVFLKIVDFCTDRNEYLRNIIKLSFSVFGFSVGLRNLLQAIFSG